GRGGDGAADARRARLGHPSDDFLGEGRAHLDRRRRRGLLAAAAEVERFVHEHLDLDLHADRAGNSGAAEPAVAAGVLGEILLVVVLGEVELRRVEDLGGDLAVAGLGEALAEGLARGERRATLRVAVRVDGGAVLGADVVALAHPLGRIVVLPEDAQQRLVAGGLRVEDDAHHLVVPREPTTHFTVGRVRRESSGIADRRGVDPRRLPELALGAPEAAHAEQRELEAGGGRRGARGRAGA